MLAWPLEAGLHKAGGPGRRRTIPVPVNTPPLRLSRDFLHIPESEARAASVSQDKSLIELGSHFIGILVAF
jgi:hypothetical protein